MSNPCTICGIETRPFTRAESGVIHAEPRTLENNLHNGTPDHNATVRPVS